VIAEAEALGRSGELPDALAPLVIGPALGAARTLILPPHCIAQLSTLRGDHPLHGVAYVPATDVKKVLAEATMIEPAAHLARLVDFCMRTRVVISVTV
jgi:hypothetical protein